MSNVGLPPPPPPPPIFVIRSTRFDQSSPVQPISEIRGGSTSVTEEEENKEKKEKKEILVSNIGYRKAC